ncbi:hypothetical protein RDWZM_009658 [Blomia tropicalis]|uniref:HBS1-like protein n=1 Tax=Blomia tropicalis TaxID=40697 RepID=A0A9Q0RMH7_BLOTA|nr:hypothetical protein RDWZM_009658 [Blomia tropicalis]
MARHRNIRSLDYQEEYNEYYDDYSRSIEEDSCISPRTASQYLLGNESEVSPTIKEAQLEKIEENEPADITLIDAKTYSCLEIIQDVVGDTIPEEDIVATIKKVNYDSEKALDLLLNRSKPTTVTSSFEKNITKGLNHHNREICLSKLFLTITSNNGNDEQNSVDFNHYNFRKYIKDFLLKSMILYQNSISNRDTNTATKASSSITTNVPPVRNNSKNDLAKLSISSDINRTKKPPTEKVEKAESPFSTPKLYKNIKSRSSDEILNIYQQKRLNGKQNLNLVIVGHVDAGKSTIMGHLLALMGMVSKKSMHKNEVDARKAGKASFMYAWVLDETEEERTRERYLEIVEKLRKFLKQVGFKDNNVHFIPCSGLTGDNLVKTSTNIKFNWYKGSTLIDIVDKFVPNERPVTKPFRMSINDIYKGQTSGICIAGKIDSGFVETNQKVLIRPLNEIASIKNIFNDDQSISEAFAGDVLTLNIQTSEGSELSIGNVLCDISKPCTMASKFEARIVIFSNIEHPITKGFSSIIYSVCLQEVARISKLISIIDKSNEVLKRNPRILLKNNNAIVEFTTSKPICIESYVEFKEYGRFIFRSGNSTVGAGIVTKVLS